MEFHCQLPLLERNSWFGSDLTCTIPKRSWTSKQWLPIGVQVQQERKCWGAQQTHKVDARSQPHRLGWNLPGLNTPFLPSGTKKFYQAAMAFHTEALRWRGGRLGNVVDWEEKVRWLESHQVSIFCISVFLFLGPEGKNEAYIVATCQKRFTR